jgi:hypothetical protein
MNSLPGQDGNLGDRTLSGSYELLLESSLFGLDILLVFL